MTSIKKKLLVLGAGGLLGSEFSGCSNIPGWEIILHGRTLENGRKEDLSIKDETHSMLDEVVPDAILNFVGLTNVDHCESFPRDAYVTNVQTIENVVNWIKKSGKGTYLIHISTDQVYDGDGPHLEEQVSLSNYYAFSKYAGELVARTVDSAVLRTNFFGKSKNKSRTSFTDWIWSSLRDEKPIKLFDDVLFSPLSMATLTEIILVVLEKRVYGVFNLGSHKGLSKADFGFYFANKLGLQTKLMCRSTTEQVDFLKTYRPKDMRMNVKKFEFTTGMILPTLEEEINKIIRDYKNET